VNGPIQYSGGSETRFATPNKVNGPIQYCGSLPEFFLYFTSELLK